MTTRSRFVMQTVAVPVATPPGMSQDQADWCMSTVEPPPGYELKDWNVFPPRARAAQKRWPRSPADDDDEGYPSGFAVFLWERAS